MFFAYESINLESVALICIKYIIAISISLYFALILSIIKAIDI